MLAKVLTVICSVSLISCGSRLCILKQRKGKEEEEIVTIKDAEDSPFHVKASSSSNCDTAKLNGERWFVCMEDGHRDVMIKVEMRTRHWMVEIFLKCTAMDWKLSESTRQRHRRRNLQGFSYLMRTPLRRADCA